MDWNDPGKFTGKLKKVDKETLARNQFTVPATFLFTLLLVACFLQTLLELQQNLSKCPVKRS